MSSAITGPIAPYNNVPIQPQYYQPRAYFIEDITLGATTLVQTTEYHDYVIGNQVRFIIPPESGCRELNGKSGYVISVPSDNEIEVDIDSNGGNAFTSSSAANQPQVLAIGDINSGQVNASRSSQATYVPGSFINISPQ